MESPYSGQTGRTTSEATTVWCGGCGIWFGSSVYRSVDAETDAALIAAFLSEGFSALNMCVCPSCSWRHVAQEAIAVHYPQRRQFFLYVPATHRHRAQTIRADFLASVEVGPGAHVPRYVFEPVLVGSRTEMKQLIGEDRVFSRGDDDDYSSLGSGSDEQSVTGSVVRRSQTLNLLAELVGESPSDEEIQNVEDELESFSLTDADSSVGESVSESAIIETENEEAIIEEEALATQREFHPEVGLEARHDTAGLGLLSAGVDERAATQSIVMPDGAAEAADSAQSQPGLDEDESIDSEVDLESVEFDEQVVPKDSDPSTDDDSLEEESISTSADDQIISVDDVDFSVSDVEVSEVSDAAVEIEPSKANEGAVRQALRSGSVELAPDYTQELEAHSRPPMEAESVSAAVEYNSDNALVENSESHRVELTDAGVVLKSSLSAEMVEYLSNRAVQVVPQLHEFEVGRLCTLTVFVESDEQRAPLYWVLDEAARRDEVLGQLEAQFVVQLDLQSGNVTQALVAEYRFPLESNVTAIRRRLETATQSEESAALLQLESESSLSTGLSHSFERDSFIDINSASDAFFALGIVEFWSESGRSLDLWGRMGFPLDWWQAIQRRVIEAAADFGLMVREQHTALVLAILELDDEATYLQTVIDNFVEVNLRIKANGLDVVQMAQVWDRLLARSQDLALPLDPEVEELASQALDKGEIALDDEVSPMDDSIDAIEISLADALEVASIGGVNIKDLMSFDRPTLSMVEPSFGEVSDSDLVKQLSDPETRTAAAATLVARGATAHYETIYSATSQMSSEETANLLPQLIAAGSQFQGLFRGGLFSDEHQQRLASALYLIELKDERVINPLLAMILDPEESEWEALALSAPGFGSSIAKPALSRVSIDASSGTRVAYLLTALEKSHPGLLTELSSLVDDAATSACIKAALGQVDGFENLFSDLSFEERIVLTLGSGAK
jgi:hypothetical protein